jgi:alkylation response protein AidB-like acyl-CoA dehydrogenase
MRFSFSEEQRELRDVVRRFLEDACPTAAVRRLMDGDSGHDPDMWSTASTQLGLPGLWVPEEFDGSGYGFLELAVVLEEWGRALAPGPLLASGVLAPATLLGTGDTNAQAKLLPGMASGTVIATVALDPAAPGGTGDVQVHADRAGTGWTVTGAVGFVLDGHRADLLLVPGRTDSGVGLFAVSGEAEGISRRLRPMLDQTRRFAEVSFSGTPADLVESEGAGAALRRAADVAAVSLALEQVGGAQRCLEMSVDYAGTRVQFGKPIGAFQAISHKCADMLLRVESARSAAYYAAWTVDNAPDRLPMYASLAKSYASEAFTFVAGESIQVHGGIGFTWEHDAQLYFKRAKSSEQLFGAPAAHRGRLGAEIGV